MVQLYAGNPVTGNDFIGRENEIDYIVELLRLRQNIVLIAPRRYGKTSLLLKVLSKIENPNMYSAFIDLFSIPTIEMLPQQITTEVLKNHKLDKAFSTTKENALAMLKNIKLKAAIEDFEFILSFSNQKENSWDLLGKSIDFIDAFPQKHQKEMVCVFDEFGDIKKLDGNKIVKLFRSKIQLHKNTSYLFSGSYESVMSNLFLEKNAPFFRFARILKLTEIEKDKFFEFYKIQLQKQQIKTEDNYLNQILDFTRGHPYYSQLALQEIIIFNALNKKIPGFNELLLHMLNTEKSYIEKSWEEISSSKENVRVILAIVESTKGIYSQLKNSGINISRSVKMLLNNGTLLKSNKTYRLSDPLLAFWIERNILKKEIKN